MSETRSALPGWAFPTTMALGLLAVIAGIGQGARDVATPAVPPDVVAMVGDVPITAARVLARVREPDLDEARLRALVEAMIDEELLFQRGAELGLLSADPIVRQRVVSEVRELAVGEARAIQPAEEELRRFHARHPQLFRTAPLVRLRQLFVRSGPGGAAAAEAATARLRGGAPWDEVARGLPDAPPTDLSGEFVPLDVLEQAYGETLGRVLRKMRVGETSGPVRSRHGFLVVRVEERAAPRLQPFEEARQRVLLRWRRQAEKDALARYLRSARGQADVRLAPDPVARLRAARRAP